MKLARSVSFVPCLLVACATTAMAQQTTSTPGQPREGIYVSTFAGASLGPQTAASFAGEYAERIHPNVQSYVTVSYHENLMSRGFQDRLTQLSAVASAITGTQWQLTGRDRGVALVGGARFLGPGGVLRPYVGGGAGALNLRRRITDRQAGNVTAAVLSDFGIGDVALASSKSLVRPLVEGTVGVGFHARRTYVDVGYRYRRAFLVGETLDFSQLMVGVGVIF